MAIVSYNQGCFHHFCAWLHGLLNDTILVGQVFVMNLHHPKHQQVKSQTALFFVESCNLGRVVFSRGPMFNLKKKGTGVRFGIFPPIR